MLYDADLVQKAWFFAAERHHGQKYPGTELTYMTHIGKVLLELLPALEEFPNTDIPLAVCCALLHDTVEDTATQPEELEAEFGSSIAAGVLALTKTGKGEAAMADSLARIRKQPREVWLVKLSDRCANLGTPPAHWNREKIQSYATEAEAILSALGSASVILTARLQRQIALWKAM